MIEAVSYRPEHLLVLALQPAQQWMASSVTRTEAEALAQCPRAIAVVDGDRVLGVAGVQEYWQGRGMVWAFLAGCLKKEFAAGHRIAKRFLAETKVQRLEAHVEIGFEAGHRWLWALGFELETPVAEKYQNGRDCSIYVRINE